MAPSKHSRMFCPECKFEQSYEHVSFFRPFACSGCGITLHIPKQEGFTPALSIGVAVSLVALLIARPDPGLGILLWAPLALLISMPVSILLHSLKPTQPERYHSSGPLGLLH